MKTQITILALLVISIIGFALFFPVRLSDNDCCLGDRWSVFGAISQEDAMHPRHGGHTDAECLFHRYVFPFGLLWWLSIALGYWSVRQLINKNVKGKNERIA